MKPEKIWSKGDPYEEYIGRWSKLVAREFLRWINMKPGLRWVDVGCGTGALSEAILEIASPAELVGVDSSEKYLSYSQEHMRGPHVRFELGNATALPFPDASFDVAVSGLALNFVSDKSKMMAELSRVVRPRGTIALYLWDYADRMELIRYFWNSVVALHPEAAAFDEGQRFPICRPEPLLQLLLGSGLHRIKMQAIDIQTVFESFTEYWTPFLGSQGPAPDYLTSLTSDAREALRLHILESLPIEDDGSIHLIARAWAARGFNPKS